MRNREIARLSILLVVLVSFAVGIVITNSPLALKGSIAFLKFIGLTAVIAFTFVALETGITNVLDKRFPEGKD